MSSNKLPDNRYTKLALFCFSFLGVISILFFMVHRNRDKGDDLRLYFTESKGGIKYAIESTAAKPQDSLNNSVTSAHAEKDISHINEDSAESVQTGISIEPLYSTPPDSYKPMESTDIPDCYSESTETIQITEDVLLPTSPNISPTSESTLPIIEPNEIPHRDSEPTETTQTTESIQLPTFPIFSESTSPTIKPSEIPDRDAEPTETTQIPEDIPLPTLPDSPPSEDQDTTSEDDLDDDENNEIIPPTGIALPDDEW